MGQTGETPRGFATETSLGRKCFAATRGWGFRHGFAVWSLVYVVAGVLSSLFFFLFGLVLLADSRGHPLTFWMLEIVALLVVWAVVLYGVRFDLGAEAK